MDRLCSYGCGRKATTRFKNGNYCCETHPNKCPSKIKQNWTEERKENERKKMIENNPMKDQDIKKRHKVSMEKMTGNNNPLYTNKEALENLRKSASSEESRKNKSIATKRSYKNKTHPSFKPEVRKILSEKNTGRKASFDNLKKRRYNLDKLKVLYPLFCKIEELKEDENGNIYARCKNHNCSNSKELDGWFIPSRAQLWERIRNLEKYGEDMGNLYCSEDCKNQCPLYGKRADTLLNQSTNNNIDNSEYNTFRKIVLERENYTCQYCGKETNIVHHEKPKKTHPIMVLDPDNGIACCKECHYKYGHSDDDCTTGHLARLICI